MGHSDSCYEEGRICYLNNGNIEDNPYNSINHYYSYKRWIDGFSDTEKEINELGKSFSAENKNKEENNKLMFEIKALDNNNRELRRKILVLEQDLSLARIKIDDSNKVIRKFVEFVRNLKTYRFIQSKTYKAIIDNFCKDMKIE